MSVSFIKEENIFLIETENTHYAFFLFNSLLRHAYWGKKLKNISDIPKPDDDVEGKILGCGYMNRYLWANEFVGWGSRFYNESTLKVTFADGVRDLNTMYHSHKIDDNGNTLIITLKDTYYEFFIDLKYKTYDGLDIIDRNIIIRNKTGDNITLNEVKSAALSFPYIEPNVYRLTYMGSAWGQEYDVKRIPITKAKTVLESRSGVSNSATFPYFAIDEGETTETDGEVWFGSLQWSGNFKITAEIDMARSLLITGGINDFDFSYILKNNESFTSPVFTLGYSDEGFSGGSRQIHEYTRNYQYNGYWANKTAPIIYNAWSSFKFDINEEKLMGLAKKSAELGTELFVVDDGWYSTSGTGHKGLGDWYPSPEKFPRGLNPLIEYVNNLGMMFGIWIEPEMVSPDSQLYKDHPDWILNFPARERETSLNRLILNLAREDVYDYIIKTIDNLLDNHNIEYLKWDINRWFSQPGWPDVPKEEQQGMWVKYVLNLHRIFEHINKKHPKVILENCASGGLRADLKMAEWCTRINRSDNKDPLDMLYLHEGFTYVNLTRAAGGAGQISPNNGGLSKRDCPMEFKAHIAVMGALGVGLDLISLTSEEMEELKSYFDLYKEIRDVVQLGDMYRLRSVRDGDHAIYEFVSKDKSEIAVFLFTIARPFRNPYRSIKLKGLDPNAVYKADDLTMSGDGLMKIGIPCGNYAIGNMRSKLFHFKRI